MTHRLTYILTTLLALVLALASCSGDEFLGAPSTGDAPAEVYVSVSLNLVGGNDAATRATIEAPGDGNPAISLEDGTGHENDIKNVELYLFDSNKTFREQVQSLISTGGAWIGSLSQITDEEIEEGATFHIVALCNHRGILHLNNNTPAKGTTLDDFIASLQYSGYTSDFTSKLLNGEATIPMWGITSVQFAAKGTITNAGSINVLRAMAKVRVTLDDALYNAGYRFTWAGITKANSHGYVAAQSGQAIATGANGNVTTAYNSTGSTPITNVSIPTESEQNYSGFYESVQHRSHVIYVPEFSNQGLTGTDWEGYSNTCAVRLDIKYIRNNDWNTSVDVKINGLNPQIYFTDYSTTPNPTASIWDIIRNDFYDFTITGIDEDDLNIRSQVKPWTTVTSQLGWGANDTDASGNALYNISFDNADEEAKKCFISKPRYGTNDGHVLRDGYQPTASLPSIISSGDYTSLSDEDKAKYTDAPVYHASLNNNSSEATFKFTFDAPTGAVWKAYLSNTDDFSLGNTNETGISRKEPYNINISARNSWYETTDANGIAYTPHQFDRRLTQRGRMWEVTGGPETDLYIVVSTDGLNEFEVVINPPCNEEYNATYLAIKNKIDAGTASDGEKKTYNDWINEHPYKDFRRYPGTDTRIRLKQLKARCGEGYYAWGDRYK